MRAVDPIAGDPWPADMVITVDTPQPLLELLWARTAWGLQPDGDTPPPLIAPPTRLADAAPPEGEAEWPALWEACVAHAAHDVDPAMIARLQNPALPSDERGDLLHRLFGPSWHERFGDTGLDGFADWHAGALDRRARHAAVPAAASPERLSVAALADAWRAGLRRVVTIPCVGEHTRVIGASALLVTETTRADPPRYAAALAFFAAGRG
jgi:hypothetical protein